MKEIIDLENKLLDSKCVIHESTNLNNILNKIIEKQNTTPIGYFTIWQGNSLINADSIKVGTFYSLKNSIENRFPLKSGYVRKAKICMDESDNKNSGIITLTLKYLANSKSYNYNFPITWGSTEDHIMTTKTLDFNYNSLADGHVEIFINNLSNFHIRLYKIYLIIYDELK